MSTAVDDIEELQRLLQTTFGDRIAVDGDIGKVTTAAVRQLADPIAIRAVQTILGRRFHVAIDGQVGPATMTALRRLDEAGDEETLARLSPLSLPEAVKASFFAGPQDVAAFRTCKARPGQPSDLFCFRCGDNGIGARGADCTQVSRPGVALPREVWQEAKKVIGTPLEKGSGVAVEYDGRRQEGELLDTMPALENIHNGCGIDLGPGFAQAFGIPLERMNDVTLAGVRWFWV